MGFSLGELSCSWPSLRAETGFGECQNPLQQQKQRKRRRTGTVSSATTAATAAAVVAVLLTGHHHSPGDGGVTAVTSLSGVYAFTTIPARSPRGSLDLQRAGGGGRYCACRYPSAREFGRGSRISWRLSPATISAVCNWSHCNRRALLPAWTATMRSGEVRTSSRAALFCSAVERTDMDELMVIDNSMLQTEPPACDETLAPGSSRGWELDDDVDLEAVRITAGATTAASQQLSSATTERELEKEGAGGSRGGRRKAWSNWRRQGVGAEWPETPGREVPFEFAGLQEVRNTKYTVVLLLYISAYC